MSNSKDVKISEWVNNGLNLFLNNFAEVFPIFLIGELILIIAVATKFGILFLHGPIACSLFYIALKKVRGKKVEVNDIGEGFKVFVPAMLAGIFLLIFTGGFLYLIPIKSVLLTILKWMLFLPGVFVAVMYMFTFLLIMDKKLDFWDAMERSRKKIFENIPGFLGFGLILGVIQIVGSVLILIGIPIAVCSLAYAYVDIFDVKIEKMEPIVEEMSEKDDPLESLKDDDK